MIKNTFKNIVFKKKKNEKQLLAIIECQAIIYVCVLFLILFVHNSLWTCACKYTSYLSLFGFVPFCVDFVDVFMFHLYIWPVLFPDGELRTWHGLFAVYLIFSFFLSPSFSAGYSPYLILLLITCIKVAL